MSIVEKILRKNQYKLPKPNNQLTINKLRDYLDLKKAVKKIHVIYQITYIISFAVLLIFFRSYFSIIGLVLGLLLVKFGIFIHNLFVKIK